MDSKEKNRILTSITRRGKISADLMKIVEEDLDAGLSSNDIEEYLLRPSYNLEMKRIYSGMLRRSATDEEKEVICNSGLNEAQMQVAFEYFCKDVPIGTIREAISKDSQPHHMKEMFESFLSRVADADKEKDLETVTQKEENDNLIRTEDKSDDENSKENGAGGAMKSDESETEGKSVKKESTTEDSNEEVKPESISPEVLALLQQMNSRMEQQDKFYEQMSGTLDKIGKQKEDDDVTKSLLEKYNSQEALIVSQQDQLNEANRALARLRAEKESAERELQRLKDLQASMEKADKRDVQEKQTEVAKETVTDTSQTREEGGQTDMGLNQNVAAQPIPPLTKGTIPVYYQVPLTQNGRVVQQVEIERSYRKSVGGVGIFSRLFLKKKSRIDLVSRLASGDMLPEQLVQIRVAIEKGLHEEQLVELINHNVPVDKMKEIIEIAVLENSMA